MAVSGLHRDSPPLVRLDAQGATVGGCARRQRGGHRGTRRADPRLRTHLLFRHLPTGYSTGYLRQTGHEGQEEPIQLLEGEDLAALWGVGAGYWVLGVGCWRCGTVAGPLLCLRAYCHQSVAAAVEDGQQRAGLHCRTLRQLCILSRRDGSAQHDGGDPDCRGDPRSAGHIGMAQRTHLLQHHLSGRYGTVAVEPLLPAEDTLRREQV